MNHISVNQTIAPTSTVTVPGLFAVPGAPVKLGDLADAQGRKLKDLVPASALTVFIHSAVNHGGNLTVEKPGVPAAASPATKGPIVLLSPGGTVTLVPQSCIELTVDDLPTHSIHAETPGDCVSVRYTRYAEDRE